MLLYTGYISLVDELWFGVQQWVWLMRAQVGAKGSGTSKDVAGKMMGGPAGDEQKKVDDADNSGKKVGEELSKLHEGRGAKSVRAGHPPASRVWVVTSFILKGSHCQATQAYGLLLDECM